MPQARHRLVRSIVAAGIFLLAAGAAARAEEGSPWRPFADRVFRPVAQNADLPHALIPLTMAEGPAGFLWLGGDVGLLRWDGYEFRDYPAQPALADGLQNAGVWNLHRDANRTLWVGTKSAGLARYDPTQDRIVCVHLTGAAGCGRQHVWSIADDGQGGIWVGTDAGLFRLDSAGNPRGTWLHIFGRASSLPDDEVLSVLRDPDGTLWIGTKAGLVRSRDDAGSFSPVPLKPGPAPAVAKLMRDSAGRIWVGTRQDGAFVIAADRKAATAIPLTAPSGPTDTAPEITAVLEITPGRIWLGTDGNGIVEVDADNLRAQRILHDPLVPNSLEGNSVQSLYQDRSGIVWIGTETGLSQYDPSAGIMTLFGRAGNAGGLPGGSAMALLAAPDGTVWAGTQSDGFVALAANGTRTTGLPGHRVFAMTPAPGGGALLGTDDGLYLADSQGSRVTRLELPDLGTKVEIRALRAIGGSIWLSGREGGLWQLRLDPGGRVTMLRHETAPRLTDSVVVAMGVAPDGRLAIGTNNGFNLLDSVTGAIEQVLPDPARPRGLDSGLVGAFANDRLGRLWVGTTNGLDVLIGRDGAGRPLFHRIGMADGLPNAAIDGLVVDHQGFIWAATDLGLAVIDPDNFSVRALQRADGLAITNYWSDSAAITRNGDLMFGGIGGLTLVRPDLARQWRYRPPVVFTAARIGGRILPVTVGGGLLVVPPGVESVAVEFSALDFSAPSRNRYRYRLDGFDADWIDTDAAHRVASYTNLPPGDYVLRLRGSNRDGQWSEPEATLRLAVLPAWYQASWFRFAAAAGILLVLAGLLRGWTAILRRRQHELERQVADRTAELSVSKIALQHANSVLERRVAERTHDLMERSAALEASEARFRAWFDNAEDAVFVVQIEGGKFTYEAVNEAVLRVFGIDATAALGREPTEVFADDFGAGLAARFRTATQGAPIQFEAAFAAPNGDRLLDTWIVPLRNPVSGRIERLVGASRDITERRHLESRLAQAQKLQALGGLAGGIAHDFNNILQAVAGAAMLIEQQPDDPERIQRLARSTCAAAERGTSITRRLLAFARSDDLRVEAIATAEVLEGLAEVLSHTLGTGIEVRTRIAGDLPRLLADRGQLETALVNLGTNARDAMPHGGVITLAAETEQVAAGAEHPAGLAGGAYVRIDFADSGCGMDAATLSRVIEPFFTTKPPGQGTGLGLALVKGFTEQSGGGMVIDSTPRVGTIVRLWLRQAAPEDHPASRQAAPSAADTVSQRIASAATPPRVLVVDDDELVRDTMAEQLASGGFTIVTAASGAEALAVIQSAWPPDAVVCDLSMPGISGTETISRARALRPGLPCFLLTGYAGERVAAEAGHEFTLLRKPISAAALIGHIETALVASTSRVTRESLLCD